MNPLTFEQILTIVSVCIAAVMALLTIRRDSNSDKDKEAVRAAERQAITSKLDTIADMSKETRDTVRELSRSINDHGQVLSRHTQQIEDLERRMGTVEQRCEKHFGERADE